MPTSEMMLSDGDSREVDAAQLRKVARKMPTISDDDQIRVEVEHRLVSAIELVSRTLNVEPDLLLLRSTVDALSSLGFKIRGARRSFDTSNRDRDRNTVPYFEPIDESISAPARPLVPERSTNLQRLAGEWAALRNGQLVDHDHSLIALTDRNRRWETVYARIPDKHPRKA